jgi:SET domain-containing protein
MKIIITESQKKMLLESIDSNLYYIEKVPKKGMSLFSNKDVKKGEEVGKLLSKTKTLNGRPIWQIEEKLWETDVIGRYINHSSKPNTKAIVRDGEVFLIAVRDINKDEEITINYSSIEKMLGVDKGSFLLDDFID